MRKLNLIAAFATIACFQAFSEDFTIHSPNGKIELKASLNERIVYSVKFNNDYVLLPSPLSLTVNNNLELGLHPELSSSSTRKEKSDITPLYGTRKSIPDEYEELTLVFKNNFSVIFRAYNEGVTYRFVTNLRGDLTVINELVRYQLTSNPVGWFSNGTTNETSWTYRATEMKDKSKDLFPWNFMGDRWCNILGSICHLPKRPFSPIFYEPIKHFYIWVVYAHICSFAAI